MTDKLIGDALHKAHDIINGARQNSYGDPENCFSDIAQIWDTYLAIKYRDLDFMLTSFDVAVMMMLLKIVRELNNHNEDNIIDMLGYGAIAGEINKGGNNEV